MMEGAQVMRKEVGWKPLTCSNHTLGNQPYEYHKGETETECGEAEEVCVR